MGLLNYLIKKSAIEATENVLLTAISKTAAYQEGRAQIIKMPCSAHSFRGRNYHEVIEEIKTYGFHNIVVIPKKSLLSSENAVKEVSINGHSNFMENKKFELNALVTITYSTSKFAAKPFKVK